MKTKIERRTIFLFWSGAVLLFVQAPMLLRDLRTVTLDVSSCYLPWYDQVLAMGRFKSLQAGFANYTPPTIYLFSLLSFFNGLASEPVLLKVVNVPFILASGWLAFDICRAVGAEKKKCVAVAILLMLSPEIWRNGLRWGQYDVIYTCFLLAFYRLVIAKKPIAAMALVGTALAFKLQAIFAAPILIALLLTGEFSVWQFAVVPVMYILWMVPAFTAGRPWKQLLLVYLRQFQTAPKLSADAPNFYFFIQNYVPPSVFGIASKAATLSAMAASVLIIWAYWRYRSLQTAKGLLFLLTLCLLIVPYLLPRMHERYFFAGDAFAILLIAVSSSMWLPALLLQATAFLTYRQYFLNYGYTLRRRDFVLPFLMFTVAMLLIAKKALESSRSLNLDSPGQDR